MADLHLSIDVAIGTLLARALWAGLDELVMKPLWRRLYRRADEVLADLLPDLP